MTGIYTPDALFSKNAAFFAPGPTVINNSGSTRINACLVGQNSTGIIVAFRGTIPPGDPDSWYDWFQDFMAEPVVAPPFPGKVHWAFSQDIGELFPSVLSAVKAFNPSANPVYVTGHSKGGALASLCAYLLVKAGIAVKQVVTFASPKTGDSGFQSGYQQVIPNQVRYENYGDLVPLAPPADEFISGLAKVVYYIPDIGPKLAALINEAANWDYQAVGSELFIESASNNYQVNPNESDFEQVADFIFNLGCNIFDPITALGNAHSLHCGYGYINGACPSSICLST